MKILIVEDNRQIMETLCDILELKGHIVDCAWNGEAAVTLIQQGIFFDVIIMDIMMPKLDGIQTVQQMRQEHHLNTPILFLTARDSLLDKTAAFEAGGDDYLVKPFAMEELILRLDALSKRGPRHQDNILSVGDLQLNIENRHVKRSNEAVKLSSIQFQILTLLMKRYPAIVSRQQLFDSIWQGDEPDSDALRSHIYALRNSIDKGFEKKMLETVHGQGYRLVTS
ncbi:response regulator transcription factor [Marinomonas sp. A79]|uniref:Response regulator transcription factor n=1 Tax=Marinomonas vulgaris TaxID=2823372 RepID=A0ABS5H9V8_9GAMM|nr:response regulator transcription factor [Marinomonas vulgaris]MBR7888461.1 response regulator transcription factor [Marinomonas vulgaris]